MPLANITKSYRFGTKAVHDGSPIDPVTGAVIEPVSSISTSISILAVPAASI